MKKRTNPNERYHVRSVERSLIILKVFLGTAAELSAGEIGKRTKLDPSTTFRLLATLESHGFVRQDDGTGKYRLGVQCLELGSQFLRSNDVRESSLKVMQSLRDQFGETVHLGILDGEEIVYLEKVAGSYAIGLMSSRVGGRAPAYSTAIGKVLLAHLHPSDLRAHFSRGKLRSYTSATITAWQDQQAEFARIQEQHFGIDNEENEVGVKCVAVPIFSHKGICAALSISGPVVRMDEHINKDALIEQLKKATTQISVEIGWGRGVDQIGTPVGAVSPSAAASVKTKVWLDGSNRLPAQSKARRNSVLSPINDK